jgi:hypothetical protein
MPVFGGSLDSAPASWSAGRSTALAGRALSGGGLKHGPGRSSEPSARIRGECEPARTAAYLHDGSITSIEALLTEGNRLDRRGRTSHLSADQIRDLAQYVLSL